MTLGRGAGGGERDGACTTAGRQLVPPNSHGRAQAPHPHPPTAMCTETPEAIIPIPIPIPVPTVFVPWRSLVG
jgi:hypothetical protein